VDIIFLHSYLQIIENKGLGDFVF